MALTLNCQDGADLCGQKAEGGLSEHLSDKDDQISGEDITLDVAPVLH